jgi:hypothetical protein
MVDTATVLSLIGVSWASALSRGNTPHRAVSDGKPGPGRESADQHRPEAIHCAGHGPRASSHGASRGAAAKCRGPWAVSAGQ